MVLSWRLERLRGQGRSRGDLLFSVKVAEVSLQLFRAVTVQIEMRSHAIHAEAHDGSLGVAGFLDGDATCLVADEVGSKEGCFVGSLGLEV